MPEGASVTGATRRRWVDTALLVCGLLAAAAFVYSVVGGRDTQSESFDTPVSVRGAVAAGPVSARLRGEQFAKTLPPLDDPEIVSAENAVHMRPDDVVMGVIVADQPRAYPWWVVKNYHVVNDRIEDTPVLIAFCEQCSAGTAFTRELDGRVLKMEMPGVCNGTIMLRDSATKSLWAPFDGRALEGPLAGKKLRRLPVHLTRWRDWKSRHPDTDVLLEREERRWGHGAWYHPGKYGVFGMMGETIQAWDTRLPENEMVYGVIVGPSARAFPAVAVKAVGGVLNDGLNGAPVLIMARGDYEMAGFERTVGDQVLSFARAAAASRGFANDQQTGTLWSIEGVGLEGPLVGRRLTRLEGYLAEWHVWFAYHENTDVYGSGRYQPPRGFTLPDVALGPLGQGPLEQLRRPAPVNLVVLWAQWCAPCRDKMPTIQRLAERFADKEVSISSVAIHMPNQIERVTLQRYVDENEIRFPVYLIDEFHYAKLDDFYRAQGGRGLVVPMVFVTNREGAVVKVLEGDAVDDVESVVEQLLESEQ